MKRAFEAQVKDVEAREYEALKRAREAEAEQRRSAKLYKIEQEQVRGA